MQIEFRAIVQSQYGAPETVLRIAERQFKSQEIGADDVLVKVSARPVHPGDIILAESVTGWSDVFCLRAIAAIARNPQNPSVRLIQPKK